MKREMLVAALREAGHDAACSGGGVLHTGSEASGLPGETAAEKARALLAKTGVASVAGSAFFRPGRGEDLLRFCFAKKDEDLEEACARLRDWPSGQ